MRRCNIVPLILLVLSIINFALAAPALIPGKCQVCDDVVHVPKDVITVLGKRGDESNWIMRLLETFDSWLPGVSPSSSLESGSERSDLEGSDSVDWGSGWDSVESGSEEHDPEPEEPDPEEPDPEEPGPEEPDQEDRDRESVDVDHDAPGVSSEESSIESGYSSHDAPGVSSQEPSIESGQSTMLPQDLDRIPIGMHSSGSGSDSDRWSTISNAPSAESLFENLQTANAALKGKLKVERRITGTSRGAANAA